MREDKLFGKLLPSHPDLLPILQRIREKYNIPEIAPGDETLAEILGAENEIDLEALHQDIESELRKIPELLPEGTDAIYKILQGKEENNLNSPGLDELSEETRSIINALMMLLVSFLEPFRFAIDGFFTALADNLFEFLLTGEGRELPENWIQAAYTMNMMGEPVVLVMCNRAADPKKVAQLLKTEYTKTFGSDRPKITDGHMNTADYLRMKWEGKSISYLVDIYAENHTSAFPKDFRSKEYRATKQKHAERMKKNLQRLEKRIDRIIGDN